MKGLQLFTLHADPAMTNAAVSSQNHAEEIPWIGQPFIQRWPILLPLVGALVLTALFRWTSLDPLVSSYFYDHQSQQWPWFFHSGCTLFYRGGTYPAFVLFGIGCVLLLTGVGRHRPAEFRAGLFLVLLFIIGPGLIVNHGFKNHWGRPRPHQIEEFGGQHPFVPLGSPGPLQQHNSSFPSGHAAVAFYLMSPGFILHAQRRRLSNVLICSGLLFGGLMALVRVIQGGHFVSDVLWSAVIVYFTAVTLSRFVLQPLPRVAMRADIHTVGDVRQSTLAESASRPLARASNRAAA